MNPDDAQSGAARVQAAGDQANDGMISATLLGVFFVPLLFVTLIRFVKRETPTTA